MFGPYKTIGHIPKDQEKAHVEAPVNKMTGGDGSDDRLPAQFARYIRKLDGDLHKDALCEGNSQFVICCRCFMMHIFRIVYEYIEYNEVAPGCKYQAGKHLTATERESTRPFLVEDRKCNS